MKRIVALFLCVTLLGTLGSLQSALPANAADQSLGNSGVAETSSDAGEQTAPEEAEEGASEQEEEEEQPAEEETRAWNIIDESTVEVYDYDQLVDALRDARYTDIYFGADITATMPANDGRQAIINKQKAEQRIYGRSYDNSAAFTFTQYNSNDAAYTIRVPNGSSTAFVSVVDMKIVGRNYYGVVQVEEPLTGVTTRYENVTYSGPQPVHNRWGTAQFANVSITLTYGYANSTGEIAEAFDLEFEGHNILDTNLTSNGNAVFLMTRINEDSGTFHVLPGASVWIYSPSYFLYSDGVANKSPYFIFDEGSSFYAECGQGFTAQYVNEVLIAPNASVRLIQSASTADGYALKIRDRFTVQDGAVFELLRPKGGAAAIQLSNSEGSIDFNNPERVILYANSSLLFAGPGKSKINIKTDALNLWTTASGGSSAAEPTQIWNKLGAQTLSVNATWSGTNVMGTVTSNLDDDLDPVSVDINKTTLALRSSQLLVLGRIELEIDPVAEDAAAVTGFAEQDATLTGTYTASPDTAGTMTGTAGNTGQYMLALNSGSPLLDSRVYVTTYHDDLRMRQYVTVGAVEEVLQFLSVPDIAFETTTLPTAPTYVRRIDPDWSITVRDTYRNSSGFEVRISLTDPMTATDGEARYTIPGALVFVDERGSRTPLSRDELLVHSDTRGVAGDHTIGWNSTHGLLLWVEPRDNLRPDLVYSTVIHWSLVASP